MARSSDPIDGGRLEAAKRRAERHRREAVYYERLAHNERAAAEQIERTWQITTCGVCGKHSCDHPGAPNG